MALGLDVNRWILGLERVNKALDILDHPERKFPHVLVGGTNGKGSVCIYLERILLSAGYSVGTTMSPHVSSYCERFRIDGRDATDDEIDQIEKELKPRLEHLYLTYFEWTVITAVWFFHKKNVDYAIFEIGLGGRLDAANALDPRLSIITGISLDHTDYLGNTIELIAQEKAAIARPGKPLLTSATDGALKVISSYVKGISGELIIVDKASYFRTGLKGVMQGINAALAIKAGRILGLDLPGEDLDYALLTAFLPGRTEHAGRFILDVAHNPDSMLCLQKYLKKIEFNGAGVLGVLKDKDFAEISKILKSVCEKVFIAPLDSPRSWDDCDMRNVAASGSNIVKCKNIMEAFNNSLNYKNIVITGSFLTVGALRNLIICQG